MTKSQFVEKCQKILEISRQGGEVPLELLYEVCNVEEIQKEGFWGVELSTFLNHLSFAVITRKSPQIVLDIFEDLDTQEMFQELGKAHEPENTL